MSGKRYGKLCCFETAGQWDGFVAEDHHLFQSGYIAETPMTGAHGRTEIVFHGMFRTGGAPAFEQFYIALAGIVNQFGIQSQTGNVY